MRTSVLFSAFVMGFILCALGFGMLIYIALNGLDSELNEFISNKEIICSSEYFTNSIHVQTDDINLYCSLKPIEDENVEGWEFG